MSEYIINAFITQKSQQKSQKLYNSIQYSLSFLQLELKFFQIYYCKAELQIYYQYQQLHKQKFHNQKAMLNFIQNRQDQPSQTHTHHNNPASSVQPSITGITRKPAITYGMSIDTPYQFVNNYSMLATAYQANANINPHYNYQQLRISKLNDKVKRQILRNQEVKWRQKTNINLVQEEKVVNFTDRYLETGKNRGSYHQLYHQELKKGNSRFRLTKGQFTNFLHTQRKNEILGPLEGPERTLQRARQTRRSIMQQSISSLQKLKSNPSLLSTFRNSTIYSNEKRKLRKSRGVLHSTIKAELESRRYQKSPDFLLPKVNKVYKDGHVTISQKKKNLHKMTQNQLLCQSVLEQYFKTIDNEATASTHKK